MLRRIVLLVIHPHDEGDVFVLTRCGDDYFLRAGCEVALCLGRIGEKAGALEHNIDAQLAPRHGGRPFLDREALDFAAVNDEQVVFLRAGRFRAAHLTAETTLDGVVLEQVGEIVGGNEIVHRHDVDGFAEQALIANGTKNKAPDPPETVNGYFNHNDGDV